MSTCPNCPTQTVVDPPQYVYENYFHPQIVQVIHPIEVIKQHHCMPVPHHIVTVTEKDIWCTAPEAHAFTAGLRGKKSVRRTKK